MFDGLLTKTKNHQKASKKHEKPSKSIIKLSNGFLESCDVHLQLLNINRNFLQMYQIANLSKIILASHHFLRTEMFVGFWWLFLVSFDGFFCWFFMSFWCLLMVFCWFLKIFDVSYFVCFHTKFNKKLFSFSMARRVWVQVIISLERKLWLARNRIR
mgnify:CR=1 FL=1